MFPWFLSNVIYVRYFLSQNGSEIRKKYPDVPENSNEFAKVIFGRGPADLSELKKITDRRRMELAEKAKKYNVPPVVEETEKKN